MRQIHARNTGPVDPLFEETVEATVTGTRRHELLRDFVKLLRRDGLEPVPRDQCTEHHFGVDLVFGTTQVHETNRSFDS